MNHAKYLALMPGLGRITGNVLVDVGVTEAIRDHSNGADVGGDRHEYVARL